MVISIVRNLYQTDTAKIMHDFFVHVLVDRSFKFAHTLSCHRNAIFYYSVFVFYFFTELLFLFDFVNLRMLRSI